MAITLRRHSLSSASSSSSASSTAPVLRRVHIAPPTPKLSGRLAEVAGGTAAECAAICFCVPCGLAVLLFCALVKMPAGLCRRVVYLDLKEVEKVLSDVHADDVRVIPVKDRCGWTDFMVIATGRSTWHVRNIAQALIHKVKQKQKGAERMLLPTVQGHGTGNWIVIDSGNVIVHALEEKARAYYNLESLWTSTTSPNGSSQDLEKAIVKTRRKNNSKKPVKSA